MIFKSLLSILITTSRWQLWLLTLLLLSAIPAIWYRVWYAPRKAACSEHERLVHALEALPVPVDEPKNGAPSSPDYFRRAIIQGVGDTGVVLEKISISAVSTEQIEVAFSGSYENLTQMIMLIEDMPLRWLSFVMSETSLVGTLTPQM